MTSSFTHLLTSNMNMNNFDQDRTGSWNWGLTDRNGAEVPKFKSLQPPSLPLSPSPASPSSYLVNTPAFSPTDFLSSPMIFGNSNVNRFLTLLFCQLFFFLCCQGYWLVFGSQFLMMICFFFFQTLPSPTTGAFSSQVFDWMSNSKDTNQQGVEKENKLFSDFSFQPAAASSSSFNLQSSSSMVSSVVRLI